MHIFKTSTARFALVLLTGSFVPATASAADDEFQLWAAVLGTAQLKDAPNAPRLWLDTHARRGRGGTVHILRPGLGYAFAPWISAWAGYAWVPTWVDETGERTDEHRIWQQLIMQTRLDSGIALMSRSRFEQRFSEAGDDVAFRFRQFARFGFRPSKDSQYGLSIWDELFVGLGETDWTVGGLDQNRIFVGAALFAGGGYRIEVGYLNVFLDRPAEDRLFHVLAINIFSGLKL